MTEIDAPPPGSSPGNPLPRPSARVVLLDPDGRILLFRGNNPARLGHRPFWILPGGGRFDGETWEECAIREVLEETGIADVELGPCVWTAVEDTWKWGDTWIDYEEYVFVARTSTLNVSKHLQTDEERDFLAEHRWWTLDELRATTDRLVPPALADLVGPLIAGDWPAEPVVLPRRRIG